MYIYIYTHIYVCIHMCIYIYIYIHIGRRARELDAERLFGQMPRVIMSDVWKVLLSVLLLRACLLSLVRFMVGGTLGWCCL